MAMIPHSKPSIDADDIRAVSRVLQGGYLAQGQKVLEFEDGMGRYLGVHGAVAVNSGTSALHLALLALNIGPKDEVIVPSYVCTALLNAISYTGARPRIADVKADDFNISPVDVKRKLSKKVKAIIVAHMFGCPADLKELLSLGVPVIEDCAQSVGAGYMGRKAGSWGLLSVCSFYATKVMTTGEGGMVLSNQVKLLDRVRDLRQYDRALDPRTKYNYKMTDFQAALGLSQLKKLPQWIRRRKQIARLYDSAFAGAGMMIPSVEADRDAIYYRYVVKTGKARSLVRHLKKQGIEAAFPVFRPLHSYVKRCPCPVADQLMDQCVSIPIYPDLKNDQIRRICKMSCI